MEKSFTLQLDGVEYQVGVNGNTFIINGHPFVVGFGDDGRVTVDGIGYDVVLDGDRAIVGGINHEVRVSGLNNNTSSPQKARPAPSAGGIGAIHAIMPGTIVRVLAQEGDSVKSGDVVMVLEAMKMENELTAPVSGVVKTIFARPGEAVEMNAILAEIEPVDWN